MVSAIEKVISMPLTVITLKSVPQSLRGDLTKWMQEIATGVFVGNFNTKVREQLWERVQDSVGSGEATLSYAYRNEIGYQFATINAQREVVDFDGIPLIRFPLDPEEGRKQDVFGYSDAARFRKARKFASPTKTIQHAVKPYVILDIETDGLDENKNKIIEIGAIKVSGSELKECHYLVQCDNTLPKEIVQLTGITDDMLQQEGVDIELALNGLLNFIGSLDIVGYGVNFDLTFINTKLTDLGYPVITNSVYDLMKYVKSEKLFLENYKLQTVLKSYGIDEKVPHRALLDARLILDLSTKVNKFLTRINQK